MTDSMQIGTQHQS